MNALLSKLSTGKIVGLVILGVLLILTFWVVATFNSLVNLNENAKTAQSNVEVQYQRRFDLIPNLVNAVQGIFDQERAVFIALAEARTRYSGTAPGSSDRVGAINQVESALARLLVIVENYPELKSAEAVQTFMAQLEGTENRISVARDNYNGFVNALNKKINFFPSNIIARMFGFAERARFEATEEAAKAPNVQFNVK